MKNIDVREKIILIQKIMIINVLIILHIQYVKSVQTMDEGVIDHILRERNWVIIMVNMDMDFV
jgi:hypothetical protein